MARLLLLTLEESKKRGTSNLDNLEAATWDITNGVTGTTETSNEHLVIFIDEVQTTIIRHEACDLLTVLDELHTASLTNSGVRLFGLNSELLHDNTLSMGCSLERVMLPHGTGVSLLVVLVSPTVLTTMVAELASSADSTRLSLGHFEIEKKGEKKRKKKRVLKRKKVLKRKRAKNKKKVKRTG
jgi:hypothetical protein